LVDAPRVLTDQETAELRELLVRGDTIAAIARYRALTGATLPDAAQALQAFSGGDAGPDALPPELLDAVVRAERAKWSDDAARLASELRMRWPETKILKARVRVSALFAAAWDAAERVRSGDLEIGEAWAELKQRQPGFSDAAYREAAAHGMEASR
jgi:hypothetical protein